MSVVAMACAIGGAGAVPLCSAASTAAVGAPIRTATMQSRGPAAVNGGVRNIAPDPNFLGSCAAAAISPSCLTSEIQAINAARAAEKVRPLVMNLTGFMTLTAAEQMFTLTDLERTARGLAPVEAITGQLNGIAVRGAQTSVDPSLTGWNLAGGTAVTAWVSNWSGGLDVLGSDYLWMYEDGVGYNIDCPNAAATGCWGHRDNVLVADPAPATCPAAGHAPELVMGASVAPTGYHGAPGSAEIIVETCGRPCGVTFTWRQAKERVTA